MKLFSSNHSAAAYRLHNLSPRLRKQRGVALIESLVAMLIFSFGVLGLMGLEARVLTFSVDADDRNRASLFASEIVSTMWTQATVLPASLPIATWNTNVADPTRTGLPNGLLTITPIPPVAPATVSNSADIVITWKSPARAATDPRSKLSTRVILP